MFPVLLIALHVTTYHFRYAEQYINDDEKSLPRASVILNKDFSYLPPTLIIAAEHDQLRDGCYGNIVHKYHLYRKYLPADITLHSINIIYR